MENKMLSKKMQNILITIWVITTLIAFIAFITLLFVSSSKSQLICVIIAMIGAVISYSIMSLDGKYIEIKEKPLTQHYQIKYNNYNEIIKLYQQNPKYAKYEMRKFKITNNIEGIVYYESKRHWYNVFGKELSFVFIVNMKEFDNNTLELVVDKFDEEIKKHIGKYTNDDYSEFTMIMCLDKANKEFIEYIDSEITQTTNRRILPVGIVFENNTMYIANQHLPIYKNSREKLAKEVIEIIEH